MSMRALDRKLLRDLWRLRAQGLAVALVMASGIATYVLSHTTIDSLQATQRDFYREGRFADVFVTLKRAPESVAARIRALPGVRVAETRVQSHATLDLPSFADPVSAEVLSTPIPGGLNRLYLRAGRLPVGDREAAVNEAFAQAHGLAPGSLLRATLNGRRQVLTVTGIVLSPEFVYLIRVGDVFPDYRRHAVLWMARVPLASAQGMSGAFNSALVSLAPGAQEAAVIEALDALLEPYGSTGAIGRSEQVSHRYLSDEIRQLETQARIVPLVFLGVAAFLLNVVLSRLLSQERVQIALLKAFGYSTATVASHYLSFVGVIVLVGVVTGLWAGAELGAGLAGMYSQFFRYPFLRYEFDPAVAWECTVISGAAALAGALSAVLRAAWLPPAEGMRPEPPPAYRLGRARPVAKLLRRHVGAPARMVARRIARRPFKSGLTVLGIALSAAIVTVGGFMEDAVDAILDVQFRVAHRADLVVTFMEPRPRAAVLAMAAQDGVRRAEPFRAVSARLIAGHRSRRVALQGYVGRPSLHRLLDEQGRTLPVAAQGLMLTDHLAARLGVLPGDMVMVEVLEGRRRRGALPVARLVHDLTGHGAYLEVDTLNRWLGEGDAVSGVFLDADDGAIDGLYAAFKRMPVVGGVMNREVALRSFRDTMGETLLIFGLVNLVLASTIAVGVVYNGLRTALSERERELASLRVLGYTAAEVAFLLIGEIMVLTIVAIPVGFALGHEFCAYLAGRLASDLYRIPVVFDPPTYAWAALVVLVTTSACAGSMVRHVRRLDLVGALKVPQ